VQYPVDREIWMVKDYETPLQAAITHRNFDTAKALMRFCQNDNDWRDMQYNHSSRDMQYPYDELGVVELACLIGISTDFAGFSRVGKSASNSLTTLATVCRMHANPEVFHLYITFKSLSYSRRELTYSPLDEGAKLSWGQCSNKIYVLCHTSQGCQLGQARSGILPYCLSKKRVDCVVLYFFLAQL
jgi:hypothetical protein